MEGSSSAILVFISIGIAILLGAVLGGLMTRSETASRDERRRKWLTWFIARGGR